MIFQPSAIDGFRKLALPEIVVGRGCRHLVAPFIRRMETRRTLLVTDHGVLRAGWGTEVLERLRADGIATTLFTDVTPNPKNTEVMAGAQAYARDGCESIVAVGGGSVLDCAKAIAVAIANDAPIDTFEGVVRVAHACPPIACIPTTTGSAADLSQFVLVSNPAERRKMAIVSQAVVPDLSLVDPETTHTMDARLTTAGGVSVMSLAFEAFLSTASSTLSDVHALEAVRLAAAHLAPSVEHLDDVAHRDAMVSASVHAGIAFSSASLGIAHAMAHAAGGVLDLCHGECLACVLPHAVRFSCEQWSGRHDALLRALVGDAPLPDAPKRGDHLAAALRRWIERAHGGSSLARLGVDDKMISELAQFALRYPCLATAPRMPSQKDLERLYEQAL